MLLADISLPKRLKIPAIVRAMARSREIDTSYAEVPFGADCWIACQCAWPHDDAVSTWRSKLFLTLTIIGNHKVGDAHAPDSRIDVPPGALFVIDPCVVHWLAPDFDEWCAGLSRRGWIGVQWEVQRDHAQQLARDLVANLGGRWHRDIDRDPRYAHWHEPAKLPEAFRKGEPVCL